MPRFAANLSMLYNEHPFLDRFHDAHPGVTGRVFEIAGGKLGVAEGWAEGPTVDKGARWEAAELGGAVRGLLAQARAVVPPYGA